MTTVRGKAPLQCTFAPEVVADSYGQKVVIKSGGWNGTNAFSVHGVLSTTCTRNLILNLRKALRQVRDETRTRLDQAVTEAEKPL